MKSGNKGTPQRDGLDVGRGSNSDDDAKSEGRALAAGMVEVGLTDGCALVSLGLPDSQQCPSCLRLPTFLNLPPRPAQQYHHP